MDSKLSRSSSYVIVDTLVMMCSMHLQFGAYFLREWRKSRTGIVTNG